MKKIMTLEEIMKVIPNRFPIYYLDYIEELEDGKVVTAVKNLTMNEDFFQGFLPEKPMMPGTLIIEALAQAGSFLILQSPEFAGKTAYIGGIDKAFFHKEVVPGDVLKLTFEITKFKGSVGKADAVATVDGENVAECVFTFIVGDKEQAN